jgi:hypothetical protein
MIKIRFIGFIITGLLSVLLVNYSTRPPVTFILPMLVSLLFGVGLSYGEVKNESMNRFCFYGVILTFVIWQTRILDAGGTTLDKIMLGSVYCMGFTLGTVLHFLVNRFVKKGQTLGDG